MRWVICSLEDIYIYICIYTHLDRHTHKREFKGVIILRNFTSYQVTQTSPAASAQKNKALTIAKRMSAQK